MKIEDIEIAFMIKVLVDKLNYSRVDVLTSLSAFGLLTEEQCDDIYMVLWNQD